MTSHWPVQFSVYVRHFSHFLANYKSPQQLDYRENWIYAYRIHQFSQNNHPCSIAYEYHFCWVVNWMHASWKFYHNRFQKQKSLGWLDFSPLLGKDSDDEVATEQLTAVVDVTSMSHNDLEISTVKRSINQRHCDRAMYQVMVGP